MTSNSHPSINDRLLSPPKRSRLNMHPSTDASPDSAANEPRLTFEAANKIVKKLSPDMVDSIFKFISGEEVMRTTDVARILSYLGCKEIVRARRVSKKWRDAAKMTVPTSEFVVNSVRSFNTMRVMTAALPNLQQLSIYALGDGHKYCDGEDPDEAIAAETAYHTTHDIDIISNFRRLQTLEIYYAPLNGIYPVLFNFPLLQKFTICESPGELSNPKWNLNLLSGLPSLKELDVYSNGGLSGNVRSLRVLKDTVEKVDINYCHITGNFMDLADFPRLKVLDLRDTAVTGDVRNICGNYFPALEKLLLPSSVIGGIGYMIHSIIAEVPSFMHAIHRLMRRNQHFIECCDDDNNALGWSLSKQSPDWYDRVSGSPCPPFDLQIIQVRSRFGWSWCSGYLWSAREPCHSCEINWLDPEPSSESSDYEAYTEEMHGIQQHINFYKGYYEPPNERQYRRLCEGLRQRG
mmetsp:Transcript_4740/g.7193  ORF Transcript_4740/g.7193 Transcript_4740/m.7193 type:complete len:463 (+) Transcript_4740:242-1630(+)|eukprot:scaffold26504_cov228-Skeletonema_dohrnii-CCMP3373.AAC.7